MLPGVVAEVPVDDGSGLVTDVLVPGAAAVAEGAALVVAEGDGELLPEQPLRAAAPTTAAPTSPIHAVRPVEAPLVLLLPT
ncbi:MAG: hypothetical protein U0Q07_04335 [Acidimicrobiales bacterium]